jgi:hypothetical protein
MQSDFLCGEDKANAEVKTSLQKYFYAYFVVILLFKLYFFQFIIVATLFD